MFLILLTQNWQIVMYFKQDYKGTPLKQRFKTFSWLKVENKTLLMKTS